MTLSALLIENLVGCTPTSENSLLGDSMDDSFCPPECVESVKPSASSLFIKMGGSLVTYTNVKLDITGTCRTLYSNSAISFYTSPQGDTTKTALSTVYDTSTGSTQIPCKDGKFSVVVDFSSKAAALYTLYAQITSIDEQGQTVTNNVEGIRRASLELLTPPAP